MLAADVDTRSGINTRAHSFMNTGADAQATQCLSYSAFLLLLIAPDIVYAHAAEQGYILLLPTRFYLAGGTAAVALTALILFFQNVNSSQRQFVTKSIPNAGLGISRRTTSLISFGLLISLVLVGFSGSGDPLRNMLPLFIWTIWWIGLVALQGFTGNLWHWINPWTGIYDLIQSTFKIQGRFRSAWVSTLDTWPAVLLFLLFMAFFLSSVTLNSPSHLAALASLYSVVTLSGLLFFGETIWYRQFECFSVFLRLMSLVSPIGRVNDTFRIGLPGWKIHNFKSGSVSLGIFSLIMLGCGSFDGLNETFWWLNVIGVNPLDFPGRSAIRTHTIMGLLGFNVVLIAAFSACIAGGLHLASHQALERPRVRFEIAFSHLALTLLPIALAYHLAHFMTAFLVNIQYLPLAISDPLASGSNLLSLNNYRVKLGFVNNHHTVELIWLSQLAMVVTGHITSVVLAHSASVRLFKTSRAAMLSQIPLTVFMTAYTFLGLWLLSSPKMA